MIRYAIIFILTAALAAPVFAQTNATIIVESEDDSAGVVQYNETDVNFVTRPADDSSTEESGEKSGTEDLDIGVGGQQEDDNDGIEGEVEIEVETEEEHGQVINEVRVRAIEIRGWAEEQKTQFLEAVQNWAQVKSGQELENFAKGVLLQDENMESLSLNYGEIKVEYKMPAKFLGIFNVTLPAQTTIVFGDEEQTLEQARVKVKYPWFGFLFRKLVDARGVQEAVVAELENVQAEVELSAVAAPQASADGTVDAQDYLVWRKIQEAVQTFQTLNDVLKNAHDTAKNAIQNVR